MLKGRTTVLLADDHAATAEQLRRLLQGHFDVVGLSADGQSLVESEVALTPDAIVTDVSMPGIDGIDATALIRRRDPDALALAWAVAHGIASLISDGMWKKNDPRVDAALRLSFKGIAPGK